MAKLASVALVLVASASAEESVSEASANPIRKVVNLLQSMQKKVEAEGATNKELYDKFMCYCKQGGASLKASMAADGDKVPAVGSSIKEAETQKAQAQADLKQAQVDRSDAKAAMASATAMRNKEAKAFAELKGTYTTNIASLEKATAAIENGMFLQTASAQSLRRLALDSQTLEQQDRSDLLAFLAGTSSESAPSSGEVVGILKQMHEEMSKTLKDAEATENGAIQTHDELMASKTKEVNILTASIEAKTVQIGELGISIVQMNNDLSETQAALLENQKLLADMEKSCSTRTAEWQEAEKLRGEELAALSETIKVLGDDEATELFKKTLPSASSSFVQVNVASAQRRARALAAVRAVRPTVHMDLISLALRGKKVGFEKIISMIDEMTKTLKKEQHDDDHKREYCNKQFDFTEDKKKGLERQIQDTATAIANAEEGVAALKDEIAALKDGIADLDKEVAKAAEQRKDEAAAYAELLASDTAAKELLLFAKNRLNKFYNPALYQPPQKVELSAEDRIAASVSGTEPPTEAPGGIAGTGIGLVQVHAHVQREAPEGPAAYQKKSEESGGVIAMIDLLVKDLDAELTEAKVAEEDAGKDHASLARDSAQKRAQDSSALTEKESALADTEAALDRHRDTKVATTKELMGVAGYLQSLHNECDWLIKYFDVRRTARNEEIDGLANARAVLSGADYSFVQLQRRELRGSL